MTKAYKLKIRQNIFQEICLIYCLYTAKKRKVQQQVDIRMRSHGLRQLDDVVKGVNRLVACGLSKLVIHRLAASSFDKV